MHLDTLISMGGKENFEFGKNTMIWVMLHAYVTSKAQSLSLSIRELNSAACASGILSFHISRGQGD